MARGLPPRSARVGPGTLCVIHARPNDRRGFDEPWGSRERADFISIAFEIIRETNYAFSLTFWRNASCRRITLF